MKKAVTALILAALVSGCALFPSDPDRPGYQEGRTAAFFYVMSEPVQPPEINEALRAGYLVLKTTAREYDGANNLDIIVQMEIAELYPDTTPEFREFVFNFYQMARTRLLNEIDLNVEVPTTTVVDNFLQGVEDSLKDWKGE
jgi:hypothetical protein